MTGRPKIPTSASDGTSVLLVSPDRDDSRYLRDVLSHLGSGLVAVSSCKSSKASLRDGRFGIVITERDLPDGNWLDVLSSVQSLSNPPLLIVVSRLADEYLWAEVLNRCGYDVLAKPFARDEVMRVVGHALHTYNCAIPRRSVK